MRGRTASRRSFCYGGKEGTEGDAPVLHPSHRDIKGQNVQEEFKAVKGILKGQIKGLELIIIT